MQTLMERAADAARFCREMDLRAELMPPSVPLVDEEPDKCDQCGCRPAVKDGVCEVCADTWERAGDAL